MLADSLGLMAVIITVLQNGVLYALLGSALWLLIGPISIRHRMTVRVSAAQRIMHVRRVRRYAYGVLGGLSLALSPLVLLTLYLGDVTTKLALLASTTIAAILVGRQPVFPFSHLLTRRRRSEFQEPTLEPLEALLNQTRSRSILAVSGLWMMIELWVAYVGWEHGWTSADYRTRVDAPIEILWVTVVVSISLAATSALLWLSFHLLASCHRKSF